MDNLYFAAIQYLEGTASLTDLEVMYGLDKAAIKKRANKLKTSRTTEA